MLPFMMLVASSAIAGCATTGDVMQRSPAVEFTSAQTAQQVSGCIAPRIFKDWGESKVSPDGAGSMIMVAAGAWGGPTAIINVQPSGIDARISIRRGPLVSDRVFNGIVQTARECR
jgi:hypothetical protein